MSEGPKPGQALDVTVSSLGNAKSLRGGTRLFTPLKGADGQIYAMAQGNVIVGGAGASQGKSSVQINHLSAGRVPAGASVERAVNSPFAHSDVISLELQATDFSTAQRVRDAINASFGSVVAQAIDGRVVQVAAPASPQERVGFMARLENIDVERVIPSAKVIINARTGSVVMNQMVVLERCAVAHGNLSVTINSTPVISQPAPFSQGQTTPVPNSQVEVDEERGRRLITLHQGASLADLVNGLNSLGVTPRDMISILQSIRAAGALQADIEVM